MQKHARKIEKQKGKVVKAHSKLAAVVTQIRQKEY